MQVVSAPVPKNQGDWHLPDFDRMIRDLSTQIKFAQALDRIRLSSIHKADLLNSPTTLAADGSLHALSELYLVPPEAWEACPSAPLASDYISKSGRVQVSSRPRNEVRRNHLDQVDRSAGAGGAKRLTKSGAR